jgi:outer membrane receptor for ferrienterochelin and colicin
MNATSRLSGRAVRWVEVFGLALAVGAQSSAVAQEQALELETFQVTGSNIKRADIEGPSPVVMLDREEIERSGAATTAELLRKVIYNNAGVRDETFTQGFAPASASVDLRGLGVNRTLVLVNGRRVPVFPFAQDGSASFVDINLIPLAAVERVEILKDGASSIYGSDAIAGVVNFITRKEYEGAELSVRPRSRRPAATRERRATSPSSSTTSTATRSWPRTGTSRRPRWVPSTTAVLWETPVPSSPSPPWAV